MLNQMTETNGEVPRRKKSKLSDFFSDLYQGPNRRYSKLERVTAEISRYKSEPAIYIDEKPLLWWQARESQYPS